MRWQNIHTDFFILQPFPSYFIMSITNHLKTLQDFCEENPQNTWGLCNFYKVYAFVSARALPYLHSTA